MKEVHGKSEGPTLDQIFGVKNTVARTNDPDEYYNIISVMSPIELQDHIANNYDRVPPAINSKEEKRRLINICMKEFKKRIRATAEQPTVKQASKSSKKRAQKIFNSFGL